MAGTYKGGRVDSAQVAVPVTRETAPELWCRADGCPLRWSVQTGDVTACSYHAWAEAHEWPRITEELLRSGPWSLRSTRGDTHTVADMKTRLRPGFKFPPIQGAA